MKTPAPFFQNRILSLFLITGILCTGLSCNKNNDVVWIDLFNGKDLTGWNPKIRGYALGENFGNTFRIEDGVIKVSYEKYDVFNERFGHLFYKQPYSHYLFTMEYRFVGTQANGGPGWALRNSGVMLHSQVPKTMTKDQDFPISLEVQLLGGDGTNPRTTANLCTPGTEVMMNGKLITDHCINSSSDTFHGEQWVTLTVVALGDSAITHYINGNEVMHYEKPTMGGGVVSNHDPAMKKDGTVITGGYISLQSESHPVEFRNIRLMDLSMHRNDPDALKMIVDKFQRIQ